MTNRNIVWALLKSSLIAVAVDLLVATVLNHVYPREGAEPTLTTDLKNFIVLFIPITITAAPIIFLLGFPTATILRDRHVVSVQAFIAIGALLGFGGLIYFAFFLSLITHITFLQHLADSVTDGRLVLASMIGGGVAAYIYWLSSVYVPTRKEKSKGSD